MDRFVRTRAPTREKIRLANQSLTVPVVRLYIVSELMIYTGLSHARSHAKTATNSNVGSAGYERYRHAAHTCRDCQVVEVPICKRGGRTFARARAQRRDRAVARYFARDTAQRFVARAIGAAVGQANGCGSTDLGRRAHRSSLSNRSGLVQEAAAFPASRPRHEHA